MVLLPSNLRNILLGVFAVQALSSRISFFSDTDCADFKHDIQGPNGYPDGECSLLESKGNFSSFKVVRLDQGCDVTIYGPDTSQGICSPDGSIVAALGRCYSNSNWTYYSIDTCIRQQESNSSTSDSSTSASTQTPSTSSPAGTSAAPQTSATNPSSTNTASSGSNTGAIAGGVVGGVVGLALIIGGIWFFLRRRKRQSASGSGNTGPVEVSGEPVVEMSAKEVPEPSELPEPMAEADNEPPPQELSADGERGMDIAIGGKSDLKSAA